MKRTLKIAFIVDESESVPAWYYETIDMIASKTEHELIFIKRNKTAANKPPFFYRLFRSFENYWFKSAYDAALLKWVKQISGRISFIQAEWTDSWLLTPDSCKTIKERHLDLIYSIDYQEELAENLSDLASYGLWYVRFGKNEKYSSITPGFAEVMSQQIITCSSLMAKKKDDLYELYNGKTKTVRFSVKNNFNSLAWKTASFLFFRIEELSASGEQEFLQRFAKTKIRAIEKKSYPNLSIPFLFLKNSAAYVINRIRSQMGYKRFSILYAKDDFDINELTSIKFNQIPLPENVFYADPFLIEKDGTRYIFFEEFIESKNKGHISVMTIDENNRTSAPVTVLDLPYHLSYPFVFVVDETYYMIPESSANKTVSLFKAKNFPLEWEFEKHLIENEALIDATVHYENGTWWLFACNALHPFVSTNDQLFIYYSHDIFSNNWKAHPQNPVITSIDNCRPAGRIFRYQNKLYRPAQNNANVQYGFGLKFNEIIVLNENEYKEKEVISIDPSQLGLKACHHIDFVEGFVVIDGMRSSSKQ